MPKSLKLLMCVLLAGCASKPLLPGQVYQLAPPDETARNRPVAVEVSDDRPEWERRYYPGASDPHRYELAITFWPLETFAPATLQRIESELGRAASQLDDPPERALGRLQSFRVVQNEVAERRAAYERMESDRWLHWEPEPSEEFFGEAATYIVLASMETALRGAVRGLVWCSHPGRWREGPPKQLKADEYSADFTCDLKVEVTLTWSDGRQRKLDLRAVVNSAGLPQNAASSYRGDDIRDVVQAGIVHLGKQLTNQLQPPVSLPQEPDEELQ